MRLAMGSLACGAAFGFVLSWAHLYDPEVIHSMLRLSQPYVFLLMGCAIGTGFVLTRALRFFKIRSPYDSQPVCWRTLVPTRNHVAGGILFGLGWSVANTCPGPIAVQMGRGEPSGFAAALGLLAGIALRDARTASAPALDPSAAPSKP